MSRILIDSLGGDGFGLGLKLEAEGHEVVLAIAREESTRVGDNLIEKVDDAVATARKVDFVIVDQVSRGATADLLRESGVPVFGAGRALDLLELDRIRAMDVFRGLGLNVPPYEVFEPDEVERAIRYVEKRNTKLVLKPCGNVGTDLTFLADDAEELMEYIEHTAERLRGEDSGLPPFLLQDFVDGAEVSTERWWAGGTPIPSLDNQTAEAKKQLAGDLGPSCGCQGNVVFPPHPALVAATVAHLDRFAAVHHVNGPIDLNCIVDRKTRKPMVLEATARLGYFATEAFLSRWETPIGEVFDAIAHGEVPDVRVRRNVGAAIPVSIPPFPNEGASKARGVPVVDDVLSDEAIWLADIMQDDDGDLVCAGSDGVVYVVTATGGTIQEAYGQCYRWLDHARLPDRGYRSDLIEHALARLHLLAKLGYDLL